MRAAPLLLPPASSNTSSLSAFKQHYYLNHIYHSSSSAQAKTGDNMRGPNAATSTTSKGGAMATAAFKRDLLRILLLGLRARSTEAWRPFDAMSLQERKRVVKCSADVAMAAARGAAARGCGRARWPKAILAAAAAASSGHSPGGTCKVRKSACCKRVVRRRPRRVDTKRVRGGYYAAAASGAAAAASCVRRRRAEAGAEEDDGAPEGDTRRERRRHGRRRAAPRNHGLRRPSARPGRRAPPRLGGRAEIRLPPPGTSSKYGRIVVIPGSEDEKEMHRKEFKIMVDLTVIRGQISELVAVVKN